MIRASSFRVGFGLATLSGCLWFLACAPFDLWALAWIASVPMLAVIDRAATFRRALFLGWWAGAVETGGGFYWLVDVAHRFASFPWAASLVVFFAFCASRALIFLLFTAIVCGIRRRMRLPMALLAPPAMVICEILVPQVFPCGQWISQAWQPHVIQIAELTGPWGVTALLMLVNGALYDLIDDPRAARAPLAAGAAVLIAALAFVDELLTRAPWIKIGLVQPNIAYTVDGDISEAEAIRQLKALQGQSQRLERMGADLTVWSEGSYPASLPRDFTADFPENSAARVREGLEQPTIIGASMVDTVHEELAYNSALLIDADGGVGGRYDKVRLLAFGEYIPGIEYFPWLRNLLPIGSGQFTPGLGPALMPMHGPKGEMWMLGPVICYEDILPGFLRRVGALHPNLLVNLTSDSWFGAGSEPWEHLALSVYASVELRVAMVRAVNSGVSALIDPNGRLVAKSYADDPYRHPRPADGLLVTAPRMAGSDTVYVRYGWWFPAACFVAVALMGALAARGGRFSYRKSR
jgi:apolipoprotein N-acyltransferase